MPTAELMDFELPIGGARPKDEDSIHDIVRGGSSGGLSFEITWSNSSSLPAFGRLILRIDGQIVWGSEDIGICTNLTPLLEWLTAQWDALILEQGYPHGVTPAKPSEVRQALLKAMRETEIVISTRDPSESFRNRHDLKGWALGQELVSCWVVREGRVAVLQVRNNVVRWSFYDVARTLAQLGDAICLRLMSAGEHESVRQKWAARDGTDDFEALAISLGLPKTEVRTLVEKKVITRPSSRAELVRDMDEFRAAARMLGSYVSLDDISVVAKAIHEIPKNNTPTLDDLSQGAERHLRELGVRESYNEGRSLARWARDALGLATEGVAVDPKKILSDWMVPLRRLKIAPNIEALSVWGPNHGPAVILNDDGMRSRQRLGRGALGANATLAHEICHLLIDRRNSLSVMEVFGGSTPKLLEQRANAFGAEFLLPMEWAIKAYRLASSVEACAASLSKIYSVTQALVAAQLLNYGRRHIGALDFEDENYLHHIIPNWK